MLGSRFPEQLRFAVVFIALLAQADVEASLPWTTKLDRYVSAFQQNGDFIGNIRVSKNGKLLLGKSYGLASRPFSVPHSASSKFLIASVTKTFTAAAIVLLQEDGKLALDDDLSNFLPDFPHASEIKLKHLLLHSSGLQNPDYPSIAARAVSPKELLQMIGSKPLLFKPGKENRYSNAGYIVLAAVVEKASGMPFCEFLARRIFQPLAMRNTGCLTSGEVVPKLAEGYLPGEGTGFLRPPYQDPSSYFGSGNLYSTAEDLDLWLRAIDEKRLLDVAKLDYPFGWGKRKWHDREILVQSGFESGYSCIIVTVPAERLHLVVLMNMQSGFTADEGKTLVGFAYGKDATPPAKRLAVKVPEEALAKYAGTYRYPEGGFPMHIELADEKLWLRWADSNERALLTPVAPTAFVDRASFGKIAFEEDHALWIQDSKRLTCPKQE